MTFTVTAIPEVTGANTSSTVTTGTFNVPAGSLVVLLVAANASTSGITTSSVTNNGAALTWSPRIVSDYSTFSVNGYSAIYTAPVLTARTGLTVTVNTAGSTSTTRRPSVKPYVVQGAHLTDPVASAGQLPTTTNAGTSTWTQVVPNSALFVVGAEWQKRGAPSSSDLTYVGIDQAGADGISALFGYRPALGRAGLETYTYDAAGTLAAAWNLSRIELRPAPLAAPNPTGVPFLPAELAGARIGVEMAFGADVNGDPDTWTWTDVTSDVRQDPPISITLGRNDEAATSQPASCTMHLNNAAGAYSLGGQSSRWPYIRRNLPVRVSVKPATGSTYTAVFYGYATGFTPTWQTNGAAPTVELEAAGTLRRLGQGASPVASALTRALTQTPTVVAYWPCEDGKSATVLAPAVGAAPLTFSGAPKLASFDEFVCSKPLPVLNTSVLDGPVPAYTNTGAQQVRALFAFPDAGGIPDRTILMRVFCGGSAARWDLHYTALGGLELNVYDRFNTLIHDGGAVGFNLNGKARRLSLEMVQVGADISWRYSAIAPDATGAAYWDGGGGGVLLTGQTVGGITRVLINPDAVLNDVAVGHLSVQNVQTSIYDNNGELNAYVGENAITRMYRLTGENNVPITIVGTSTALMGAQRVGTLLELLRECETADQGVLFDGLTPGLTYVARSERENQTPDITIDAAADQLAGEFAPVDDDQRTRNKVVASRVDGATKTVEDVTGRMGTAAIGIYDTSIDVSLSSDEVIGDYAGWLVHLGTQEGYRYPSVQVDVRATPILAPAVLAVGPSNRVDVTGVSTPAPGHPVGTLSLLVEGLAVTLSPFQWTVKAKCSSYAPWRIGVVAAPTGDTSQYLLRVQTDGSTLAAARAAGATTLSVASTGPLWTTAADDFPLVLDVGGIEVTATACTGTSSPQTFTVAALPMARPSGTPVTVRTTPALGL